MREVTPQFMKRTDSTQQQKQSASTPRKFNVFIGGLASRWSLGVHYSRNRQSKFLACNDHQTVF